MTRRTRGKRMAVSVATAVGGLLTAAGLLAGPQASAAPTHQAPAFHQLAGTAKSQAKVRAYWTPQRMRSARPLTAHASSNWTPSKVATGKPTVVKGNKKTTKRHQKGTGYLGGPWTGGGKVVQTTGKVFMTLKGVDYVCSGSAVPAQNKSLVSTAGHCVNEGPGAFVTNFEFVPGYHNGQAPYGEWSATQVGTTQQWAKQGDFNYDVGFAVVGSLNGRYLSDTVGSQSIGFNQARGQTVYDFGYPAAAPYNGETLDYAYGPTGNDTLGGSNDMSLRTNLTGGCSGGPWFENFNTSTGTGTQISVNSFEYTSQHDVMYGPYFGTVIQNTYNSMQTAQPTA